MFFELKRLITENEYSNLLWDTSTSSQVSNCDGAAIEIYLDHNFQWPQEGLNCKSLPYKVVS